MEFFLPETLAEAGELLARSDGSHCLAGGANLIQAMNAGLLEPTGLVSLRAIPDLQGIEVLGSGELRVGAMTSHRELAHAAFEGDHRLLSDAAARIGNPAIRNMGTLGGALASGDRASDYLAPLWLLEASLETYNRWGAGRIALRDLLSETEGLGLDPGTLIVAVVLPEVADARAHYERVARTRGDGPILSVAAANSDGQLRIAVAGASPRPLFCQGAIGHGEEARASLERAAEPRDDLRASAAYRRLVLPRLVERAISHVLSGTDSP